MTQFVTPQHVWQDLVAMVAQWRGQRLTLVGFWPADADHPAASFSGVVETITAAGFLLVRPVDDPENPQRTDLVRVRVFVNWADLWGPDAYRLQGRVRYRQPSGAWRVESAEAAVARWHRRYQAALARFEEAEEEAENDGLESGAPAGGFGRARSAARAAHASGNPVDRPMSVS